MRKVIENVPKVAFAPIHDGKFEFTPYPSCLKSVLRHLGNDVTYRYFLGTSGGADLNDVANHPDFRLAKPEIDRAADVFQEIVKQMEAWWKVAGRIWDDEEAQIKATADPEVRRAFVPYIRTAKEKDLEGAELISQALEKLTG